MPRVKGFRHFFSCALSGNLRHVTFRELLRQAMAEHRPPINSQAQLERMLFDAYGGKLTSWHRQVNDWFGGVVPIQRNIARIAKVLGVPAERITPTAARPPDLETQMQDLRLRQEAIATSLGDGLEEAKQMLEDRLAAIESRLEAAGI